MNKHRISAGFEAAEQRLLSECGIEASSRRVELADEIERLLRQILETMAATADQLAEGA